MVEVGDRPASKREAVAQGTICMDGATLGLIERGETPKGDLLAVARVAAIQAAKRTWELIPLCHPLPLSGMDVTIKPDPSLQSRRGNRRIIRALRQELARQP